MNQTRPLTWQCVLGYALAPILLASVISFLVHNLFVRIPVSLACWAWSVWGTSCYLSTSTLLHALDMDRS